MPPTAKTTQKTTAKAKPAAKKTPAKKAATTKAATTKTAATKTAAKKTATRKPAAKKPAARKAAAKNPAAPAITPAPTADIVMMPVAALVASDLNPRKTFNDETVAELAASIAEKGVLQNLVARPLARRKGGASHEVIAGGRRLRALQLLAKQKKIDPGADLVPVRIEEAADDEATALAILENLQREDVPPVEEAEAFQRLVAADWGTDRIAEAIGKTRRYVQKRIGLMEKLTDKVKQALADGEISIAQADALSIGAPEDQDESLECVLDGYNGWKREADIRESMRQEMVPARFAIFEIDEALILRAEDEDGEDLFRSKARFDLLQGRAVEQLSAKMTDELGWANVKVESYFSDYNYAPRKKADGGWVVIEHSYSGEVKLHEGVIPKSVIENEKKAEAQAAAQGADPGSKPVKVFNQSHIDRAAGVKTRHLQTLIAGAPETALRAAILGMMGSEWDNPVKMRNGANAGDDALHAAAVERLGPLLDAAGMDDDDREWFAENGTFYSRDFDIARLWAALQTLDVPALLDVLAVLAARAVSLAGDTQGRPGNDAIDTLIAAAAAQEAGRPMNPQGSVDDDYLASARKPELQAIARDQLPANDDIRQSGGIGKATGKKLAEGLSGKIAAEYVPVPHRFATIEAAAGMVNAEILRTVADDADTADAAPAPEAVAAE